MFKLLFFFYRFFKHRLLLYLFSYKWFILVLIFYINGNKFKFSLSNTVSFVTFRQIWQYVKQTRKWQMVFWRCAFRRCNFVNNLTFLYIQHCLCIVIFRKRIKLCGKKAFTYDIKWFEVKWRLIPRYWELSTFPSCLVNYFI